MVDDTGFQRLVDYQKNDVAMRKDYSRTYPITLLCGVYAGGRSDVHVCRTVRRTGPTDMSVGRSDGQWAGHRQHVSSSHDLTN
jgi:hypothetical protein